MTSQWRHMKIVGAVLVDMDRGDQGQYKAVA